MQDMRRGKANDRGDGIGDSDGSEAAATIERIASDRGDGIGDSDGSEAAATIERKASDRGDGIGCTAIGHGGGDGEAASGRGVPIG